MDTIKIENDSALKQRRHRSLLLAFVLPFLVVLGLCAALDYADISGGIEHEREVGINHKITEQEIALNSLKKGLLLAFPAGLIGLVVVSLRAKRNTKPDS